MAGTGKAIYDIYAAVRHVGMMCRYILTFCTHARKGKGARVLARAASQSGQGVATLQCTARKGNTRRGAGDRGPRSAGSKKKRGVGVGRDHTGSAARSAAIRDVGGAV